MVVGQRESVLLQGLPDDGYALFVRLCGAAAFVSSNLLGTETWHLHIPVALEIELDIPDVERGGVAMFGQTTGSTDSTLDKVIGHLKQQLLNLLVELLVGIHLFHQLLKSLPAQYLDFSIGVKLGPILGVVGRSSGLPVLID